MNVTYIGLVGSYSYQYLVAMDCDLSVEVFYGWLCPLFAANLDMKHLGLHYGILLSAILGCLTATSTKSSLCSNVDLPKSMS